MTNEEKEKFLIENLLIDEYERQKFIAEQMDEDEKYDYHPRPEEVNN
jgi:hypothetical protein